MKHYEVEISLPFLYHMIEAKDEWEAQRIAAETAQEEISNGTAGGNLTFHTNTVREMEVPFPSSC